MKYRRIASLKTLEEFQNYLAVLGLNLPCDAQVESGAASPLAQTCVLQNGFKIGNRFCILPMEGWDGTRDGCPGEATLRRWQRFGRSGAKLIWGGEAVAVRHDGRANPNQLLINEKNLRDLADLREALIKAHADHYGGSSDLLVGLQLTHSGRFSKPNRKDCMEPQILYHHPILDRRLGLPSSYPLMSDDDIARLVDDFVTAAKLSARAGFAFVDIKHCHGYLGHEFLSAVEREGRYGGSFENRTRFLRDIVAGVRAEVPGMEIAVRVSAFDFVPFRAGKEGIGEPEKIDQSNYPYAFGANGAGLHIDLAEPCAFLDVLAELKIQLVCITAGSPYYNPHIQRPALFPPSDGYLPPEDPLAGVARQIEITCKLKQYRPDLIFVGSGYTYLQEWLPYVAQNVVRTGQADFVGLGRMVLSYPEMPAEVLRGKPLQRKRICRTFSDCTTAPRNGLISGCYPLDDYYKSRPEAEELAKMKKENHNMNLDQLETRWRALDEQIKSWWDADLRRAREAELRDPVLNQIWYVDEEHRQREQQEGESDVPTLLYLPFPFVSPGGSGAAFPEMYCWDTYFINLGLAAHGRFEVIRDHILNQLFLIERYGFLLTGNRVYYLSRSQTPLHALSVKLYYEHHRDRDLLARAYPVLKREYHEYWCAPHHQTPIGLTTNRDLADPALGNDYSEQFGLSASRLRPELAAEAEVTDFTAIYAGDVRRCVPLQTNCALVRHAQTLAWMAGEIGWQEESRTWQAEAERRAALIRDYCWDEAQGFFFEYQYQQQKRLPFWSLGAYWTMWAGVATPAQAEQLVRHLAHFEHDHGLSQTDQPYASPHPEFNALQFNYPNGWPPFQIMVIEALEAYGHIEAAQRLAHKFLRLQLDWFDRTGVLWEKYNVVAGNLDCPRERYPVVPLHGWSSTAVACLGRKLFKTT